MKSRRELLKYFAAGTVIAPVGIAAPAARLIEAPKVELIEAGRVPPKLSLSEVKSASIVFQMTDGARKVVHMDDMRALDVRAGLYDFNHVSIDFSRFTSPKVELGTLWSWDVTMDAE